MLPHTISGRTLSFASVVSISEVRTITLLLLLISG